MTGLLLTVLIGCPQKKPPAALPVDDAPAAQILERAQSRSLPTAVRGSFGFAAELPDRTIPGVLQGNLVVQQPGHFRLDVLPPVGGQVLIGASNGEHLHVLLDAVQHRAGARAPHLPPVHELVEPRAPLGGQLMLSMTHIFHTLAQR